ncbi:hypothetical protein CLV98_104348 [Dyadobacter jejuensis]|uniref:DUF1684 domain-containing protein n=1 Tax=Dyadobacter jejuensis TaxID=1082580 RepID=A0A316AM30_9BACT|nr:DUF1684 domain-containing protein [Dyadobacter jejuensis]PWJ58488.1 hypothetical protein CLV98_104348 [Dyadobacter jejuensis]
MTAKLLSYKKIPGLILIIALFVSAAAMGQDFQKQIETHRQAYLKAFLTDSNSPLRKRDLKKIHFFEPDSTFRVEATFYPSELATPLSIPTTAGTTKDYIPYGRLEFELQGQTYNLTVYQSLALIRKPKLGGYLFLPFKDATNGGLSYGGGRYLDLEKEDIKDNRFVLDFNKAYNPYCAYQSGYSCPIPPKENHMSVAILAGEQNYGKAHR